VIAICTALVACLCSASNLEGLLTARLGLAALETTRPLPFAALRRPALNDIAGSLLRGSENRVTEKALQD
jgi:putative membrane protein